MSDAPQNGWQFLLVCFHWIGDRATRILAITQGTLAIVATQDNLLPPKAGPWLMLGVAILTFWRGQAVSKTVADAKTIVAQNAANSPLYKTPGAPL
jgi:hypothetical protein